MQGYCNCGQKHIWDECPFDAEETPIENNWISVKDEPPKYHTKFLGCLENGYVDSMTIGYTDLLMIGGGATTKLKLTHWQPLPEPPKD